MGSGTKCFRLILFFFELLWPLSASVTISSSSPELVIAGMHGRKDSRHQKSDWIGADDKVTIQILPHELTGPSGTIPVSAIHLNPTSVWLERELRGSCRSPFTLLCFQAITKETCTYGSTRSRSGPQNSYYTAAHTKTEHHECPRRLRLQSNSLRQLGDLPFLGFGTSP